MKSAPCVRLAMRIRPKMSEKPAASRNSNPPSARLFSVWMTQNCKLLFQVLGRRPVARIDRVLEELLGLVGPELAHVRIGVDDAIHQPAVLALDLAQVHVAHDVAVPVELHGPAAGSDFEASHRLHQPPLVPHLALY